MKKVTLAILLIFAFTSCQKEKIKPENPTQNTVVEKVKIFFQESGQKSTSSIEVENGDTVHPVCNNIRDVYYMMYAENESGQAISGNWSIILEYDDNPAGYTSQYRQTYLTGEQVSNKFKEYGLYKVSFSRKLSVQKVFYVLINGLPGKTGDEIEGDYIFRLEKKKLFKDNALHILYFVYFKYDEFIPDESLAGCYLMAQRDTCVWFMKPVKRWLYYKEETYFYFTIDPETENGLNYLASFYITDPITGYLVINENNFRSEWTDNERGIKFILPL